MAYNVKILGKTNEEAMAAQPHEKIQMIATKEGLRYGFVQEVDELEGAKIDATSSEFMYSVGEKYVEGVSTKLKLFLEQQGSTADVKIVVEGHHIASLFLFIRGEVDVERLKKAVR